VSAPRVWIGPDPDETIADAVERGGGAVVAEPEDADAVVWLAWRPAPELRDAIHDGVRWVQLPAAGVENWLSDGLIDDRRLWTGAQGAYAEDVAEHAVAFLLAAARRLPQAARRRTWIRDAGLRIQGSTVGIVGAGGIGREIVERLTPFGTRILAQTRSGDPVAGAEKSFGPDGLHDLLREGDYVMLTAPLTGETRGLIGPDELALIGPEGWLLNVARGGLVQTDALVEALRAGTIGGACLDVTDPEPLPDGHPLWGFDNVLITPHVANPPLFESELLARRVEENVRRIGAGEEPLGRIDPGRGY
jgi:D-3-phosphoglycerate dehydrogenase